MASIINASTSGAGGLITTADSSGILQLQSGGTTIATISSTGLQQNVGAPAFFAYANAATSMTTGTATKIIYGVEDFDTNNNFASSRFTPTIAGYYQINACVSFNPTSGPCLPMIYKNGARYIDGNFLPINGTFGVVNTVTACIYFNGSTDYAEIYAYQFSGGTITNQTGRNCDNFNGFLARST